MSSEGIPTANIEYRSVIRFLTLESVSPAEIHRRLTAVYGSPVMSVQAVRKWCRLFKVVGRMCLMRNGKDDL